MRHGDLVNNCLLAISSVGALAWTNNTGAYKNPEGRLIRYGLPGSPDIVGVLGGRAIGVECKVGRDKQSVEQRTFQAAFERAGGVYVLARDVDQMMADLRQALEARS